MNPLISICIPTYEMKGLGVNYLTQSFDMISKQTFKDFEVVIGDHSEDSHIKELCDNWSSKFTIRYFKSQGFPDNINVAMKNANGKFIKPLFQDDYLLTEQSLEILSFHMSNTNCYWLASACVHTVDGINYYREFYPKWTHNIIFGNNHISSPSVIMFRNENIIEFDTNLRNLIDVDFYKRLFDLYGLPSICNYFTVVNREDESTRFTSLLSDEAKLKEIEYVVKKYKL